ncbi:Protein arginine N-methyltransferase 5 [Nymphon striatum]|nr:Protein arginine N-methyltransferase 5 [Nymphon striatum]
MPSLKYALESRYSFIVVPLVHPLFKREFISEPAKNRDGPFTRSDMLLSCQDWTTSIVARMSPWLQLDSPSDSIRRNSEAALKQEIKYAAHLGVPAISISLKSSNCVNLARNICSNICNAEIVFQKLNVWIHVPMIAPTVIANEYSENVEENSSLELDTWQWWRKFHGLCNLDDGIYLNLEICQDVPSDDVVDRWLGEPLWCIILPTSIFLSNKAEFPVLSRAHQILMHKFFKNLPQGNEIDTFARGYEDYLQTPLQVLCRTETYPLYVKEPTFSLGSSLDEEYGCEEKRDLQNQYLYHGMLVLGIGVFPLMDNLESQTYEIFERDPIKYTEYQRAICKALISKVPESDIENKTLIVMVLGAGRGPLVTASLQAAKLTERKIFVYAIEKNPNAVVTLQTLKTEEWHDQVTVVSTDMREWNPPEKADIIVSELLGSFGDNELSPECLEKAEFFLKDDGISIPSSYTSFLCPIQSAKLYNEVKKCKDKEKNQYANVETPYVVFIKNSTELAKSKKVFEFHHPNKDPEADNARYRVLNFEIGINSVLHGFAGYFEACLFDDVYLSIRPETHSTGMLSWFPILFPIRNPVYLKEGDELEVHFWRCSTSKKVWYEWAVTKPQVGVIHNSGGCSYTIGL